MSWSILRPWLAIAMTALAVSGCSSGGQDGDRRVDPTSQSQQEFIPTASVVGLDADGDGFYTFDEMPPVLDWAISQYQWPPGMVITSDLMLSQPQGGRDMRADRFEIGFEQASVGIWNTCAWLTAWVDALRIGDNARQVEALAMTTEGFAYHSSFDPGTRDVLDSMIQKAELGDPSVVQQYINANCVFLPGYPWGTRDVTGTPATASPAATPVGVSAP